VDDSHAGPPGTNESTTRAPWLSMRKTTPMPHCEPSCPACVICGHGHDPRDVHVSWHCIGTRHIGSADRPSRVVQSRTGRKIFAPCHRAHRPAHSGHTGGGLARLGFYRGRVLPHRLRLASAAAAVEVQRGHRLKLRPTVFARRALERVAGGISRASPRGMLGYG
jgi:hypothetical protein